MTAPGAQDERPDRAPRHARTGGDPAAPGAKANPAAPGPDADPAALRADLAALRADADLAALRADPELAALRAVSARLGADRLQIQAAGGNTSLKRGGAMLVKASGTWLGDALARDIMVAVRIDGIAARLGALAEADIAGLVPPGANPAGLRPSIETAVHAVIPARVVLHTHSVATLAVAIRADAAGIVRDRLAGLDAVFVPYVKPGLPLARAIAALLRPETRLLVLGNHGIVAAGGSVAKAVAALEAAEERLAVPAPPPPPPAPGFAASLAGTGYVPADGAHALALDPLTTRRAAAAAYYPDHVVFLGPQVAVADDPRDQRAPLVLVPGRGAALRADLGEGPRALAACLADVLVRVPPEAALAPLPPEAIADLVEWDAEAYRRSLARGPLPP